jgi:hypothetical protein
VDSQTEVGKLRSELAKVRDQLRITQVVAAFVAILFGLLIASGGRSNSPAGAGGPAEG